MSPVNFLKKNDNQPTVTLDRKLWLTADKETVVEDGDPAAAFLLGLAGDEISATDAARLGLKGPKSKRPTEAAKEADPADDKEATPAEDKQAAPAANKSRSGSTRAKSPRAKKAAAKKAAAKRAASAKPAAAEGGDA